MEAKHEEILSLKRIVSSFINYRDAAERDVQRFESYFSRLPPAHKALLSNYPSKHETMRRCISANSFFIYNMLQAFEPPLDMTQSIDMWEDEVSGSTSEIMLGSKACNGQGNNSVCNLQNGCTDSEVSVLPRDWMKAASKLKVPLADVETVRRALRSLVRDWTVEGQKERDECYKPILEELASLFPNRHQSRPNCLVPGAGLRRLAWDISCLGFITQGNEFSYYMMICSNFIFNDSQKVGKWTIYPWIHNNCNLLSDSDQFQPVLIPDVVPSSGGTNEGFSMCGGDFVQVYSDPAHIGAWDSVVTCFFIDTAHNIVQYIEIISNILKEGGVWINFGPLLFDFDDMCGQDDMSIELSLEDVKKVACDLGFELEKESIVETTYAINRRSMMQRHYFAAFWTMRKKSRKEHASAAPAAAPAPDV